MLCNKYVYCGFCATFVTTVNLFETQAFVFSYTGIQIRLRFNFKKLYLFKKMRYCVLHNLQKLYINRCQNKIIIFLSNYKWCNVHSLSVLEWNSLRYRLFYDTDSGQYESSQRDGRDRLMYTFLIAYSPSKLISMKTYLKLYKNSQMRSSFPAQVQ